LIVYAISESLQPAGSLSYNGRAMNVPSTIPPSLRNSVRRELASIVGSEWVLDTPDELIVYECDGLTLHPRLPDFVVFPIFTEDVVKIMSVAQRHKCRFCRVVPGAPQRRCHCSGRGIILEFSRMKRILSRLRQSHGDGRTRRLNLHLTQAARRRILLCA
jgi:glycolate oxidase